jgi:hypothetical protein
LFFGVVTDERSWILHTKEVDGQWTEPAVASFSGVYNDYDLTMSPDGNRVYFTSNRPIAGTGPVLENSDIWYVDRIQDGWGDPVRFPEPINTEMRELYPSESRDGYVYFFSSRSGGFGSFDLYRVALRGEEFGAPENLGPSINTEANETDNCISPDGDYLVFTSTRDGGFGSGDLYVSFSTTGSEPGRCGQHRTSRVLSEHIPRREIPVLYQQPSESRGDLRYVGRQRRARADAERRSPGHRHLLDRCGLHRELQAGGRVGVKGLCW